MQDITNVRFQDLPIDIINRIFSQLSPQSLATISSVSNLFYKCVSNDELWENSQFYNLHAPNKHIGETKKIITIKMMLKYIKVFSSIFLDSDTIVKLKNEFTLVNQTKDESDKTCDPQREMCKTMLSKFMNMTKEIQLLEKDPYNESVPLKYKFDKFIFLDIIRNYLFGLDAYHLITKSENIKSILEKCLYNPSNIKDIEKVKLILSDASIQPDSDEAIKLDAPYEVIEFMALELAKISRCTNRLTDEQLNVINQILSAAKHLFKDNKDERSILIEVLHSTLSYDGEAIETRCKGEALDFIREQCELHNINTYILH